MRVNTITYCIRQGLVNIRRNKLFSLASIVTIATCIFLLGVFYSIIVNVRAIAKNAEETIGVTVFFDEDLSVEEIQKIGKSFEADSRIAYSIYTSPEEAWNKYKTKYFQGNEELAEGFADDNPLAHSASYEIHLKDTSNQATFVKELEASEHVRKVNYSELAAGGLSGINRLIGYLSFALVVMLLLVSLLLISNTVRLAYTVRKEEVEITKYIGATNAFVRAPFIVEGVTMGLIGSILPLGALYGLYLLSTKLIAERFTNLQELLEFVPAVEIYRILVPVALLIGLGIGFVGSFVEIQKNLRESY